MPWPSLSRTACERPRRSTSRATCRRGRGRAGRRRCRSRRSSRSEAARSTQSGTSPCARRPTATPRRRPGGRSGRAPARRPRAHQRTGRLPSGRAVCGTSPGLEACERPSPERSSRAQLGGRAGTRRPAARQGGKLGLRSARRRRATAAAAQSARATALIPTELSVRIPRWSTPEWGMAALRIDELELGKRRAQAIEVRIVRPQGGARRDGGHGDREIGERHRLA